MTDPLERFCGLQRQLTDSAPLVIEQLTQSLHDEPAFFRSGGTVADASMSVSDTASRLTPSTPRSGYENPLRPN